ncbi:MAG: isoprenylcysteine carboxylmethyltransferase family protein [Planctomycetaceae bacterium]
MSEFKVAVPIPNHSDWPALGASGRQKTAVERARIGLTWLCVTGLTVSCLVTGSHWQAAGFTSGTMFVVGICLALIACAGRIWCSLFIDGFKTQQLISWGPYSICRNPLYLFSAIGAIGVALGSCTFALPVVAMIFFAIYYPLVIRAEEARLTLIHGEQFREYCQRVPAFFPAFRLPETPETYEVRTRVFVKSLLEATWFVWATILVHLLYELHQRTSLLPEWFRIY